MKKNLFKQDAQVVLYALAQQEKIREKWHNASPEEKAERSRKRKEYYRKNQKGTLTCQ